MITKRKVSCSLLVVITLVCGIIVAVLLADSKGVRWWEYGYYEKPAWSPDGEKVLYLFSRRPADYPDLTLIERVDSPLPSRSHKLKLPAQDLSSPAWRSNDEISVFSEGTSGFGTDLPIESGALYLYNLITETWEEFEAPLPIAAGVAWHPDGDYALISLRDFSYLDPENLRGDVYKFTLNSEQFEKWIEAEWPGSIAWSPDGDHVAFLDFVPMGNENPVHLRVIEAATQQQVVLEKLSKKGEGWSWSTTGDTGLSWSKDGSWLVINGTMIEYDSQHDYDVRNGFFFVSFQEPEQVTFWEVSDKPFHFDVSPSGEKIIFTAHYFSVKNNLFIVRVPQQFR